MRDWLGEAQRRLERGVEGVGDLGLSPTDVNLLLELAREAAHGSGERTNAPLVSYLVGLSVGRNPRVTLGEAVAISLGRDYLGDARSVGWWSFSTREQHLWTASLIFVRSHSAPLGFIRPNSPRGPASVACDLCNLEQKNPSQLRAVRYPVQRWRSKRTPCPTRRSTRGEPRRGYIGRGPSRLSILVP